MAPKGSFAFLAVAFAGLCFSAPAPTPAPTVAATALVAVRVPHPTAPADYLNRRGIIDDAGSYVKSLISDVASDLSTFVESGILDFPNGFPTGTAVEKSLGISQGDVKAQPTQVLNLPAYANWTNQGWNVRVHGNVYKLPDVSQSKIDDLANVFLVGTSIDKLPENEKANARNLTRSIFVFQQGNENVTMNFSAEDASNSTGSKNIVQAKGGNQFIKLPYKTTLEGDFDTFVKLQNISGSDGSFLKPGNETKIVQTLRMSANGTSSGNATAYLVPTEGYTIVSDIDDILRVTKIYKPKDGLLNTFAKPFMPWLNMPDIYANWSSSLSNVHFHYLTTTPEQATRTYMKFIYDKYPLGSFDTRPLNFSDVSATLQIRKYLLDKVFQTFPKRKFVLVADTSNHDVMKDYPQLYKDYPGQVSCILLRNTSSTDSDDKFPYDTSGFKGIPQEHYMFFHVPNDLTKVDIGSGQCYNSTIKQNVTFGEQGLPFGLGDDTSAAAWTIAPSRGMLVLTTATLALITALL